MYLFILSFKQDVSPSLWEAVDHFKTEMHDIFFIIIHDRGMRNCRKPGMIDIPLNTLYLFAVI